MPLQGGDGPNSVPKVALGRTYVSAGSARKKQVGLRMGPRGTLCKKSMATGENVGDMCPGSEHNTEVTVGWDDFQQVAAERDCA